MRETEISPCTGLEIFGRLENWEQIVDKAICFVSGTCLVLDHENPDLTKFQMMVEHGILNNSQGMCSSSPSVLQSVRGATYSILPQEDIPHWLLPSVAFRSGPPASLIV